MGRITSITGWIETIDIEQNKEILKNYPFDIETEEEYPTFPNIFCIPPIQGNKAPDYIFFGSSRNYWDHESWLENFEELLAKLEFLKAFVCISPADSPVVLRGYNQITYSEIQIDLDSIMKGYHDFPKIFDVIHAISPDKDNPAIMKSEDMFIS